MSIYLPAARIALLIGHRQLAAILVRTWLETALSNHAQESPEPYWQTAHRLMLDGTIDRRSRNEIKRVYRVCSRSLHGGNTKSETLRRSVNKAQDLKNKLRRKVSR